MKGPIAKGTIRTTFVLGLRLLVQAGTLLLVARMLGPGGFGAFAGITALAVILGTLSTFGSHLVLLSRVSKEPAQREQVLPYAVPTTLVCGSMLLALYLLVYALALNSTRTPLAPLLAIGLTETLLQPLCNLPAWEHMGLGRIARSQLLMLFPLVLRLASAAAVFLLRPPQPLVAYGYGYFAASAITLAIATAVMPAPWPRVRTWRWPTRVELRETSSYAVLAITGTAPTELDKTLAVKLLPLDASGLYSAGARVIRAGILPVTAMMLSTLPRLFREGNAISVRSATLLRSIFIVALCYSTLLAVALWYVAPAFVWLFGAKYNGIQHMLYWLCLAVPALALQIAAGNILMAIGKPWMRVMFEAIGISVLIIAAIVWIHELGSAGMPLALACSEWTMAILGIALVSYARKATAKDPPHAP